ncbi:MAG: flagellar motor protein MotB [Caulobacterales bacterium]|jgi:chemotaxis protein MotB
MAAAGAGKNKAPIIIKRIKKAGHGHHGGAWKVAYADFVTAMMAFFLLMWLINTTSPEQKRGIADFFAPAAVSQSTSGAGGILAGTALAEEGVQHGLGAPMAASAQSIQADKPMKDSPEDGKDSVSEPSAAAVAQAKAMREDSEFSRAEMSIRQAIEDQPDLAELSKQVIMEKTPEGLRIQLVDQEGRSMFDPGQTRPNARAERLLNLVANTINNLPNRVTISGHTDMDPPKVRAGYTNWELSADRANAARRVLQARGVTADRIYQVSGKADSEPLFPDDPTMPGNRRISITLLREAPVLPPDHSL